MRLRLLGTAAGGGFPQWNCNCPNCRAARSGSPHARPRTQSSAAVSADGARWFLLNASPDLRAQIAACKALWPRKLRRTPIEGVLLTNADLDHTLGLLLLREAGRLAIHSSARVCDALTFGSGILPMLQSFCAVNWLE